MNPMYNASKELFSARTDAIASVNAALQPLGRKLWRVSETDSYKLLRLLVWSTRYHVSLEFVVSSILSVLTKSAERRTGKRSRGLGVTISVLTGEVAHTILKERIAKEYPAGENVYAMLEEKQAELISLLAKEEIGRPRGPLAYKYADDYVRAYKAAIRRRKKKRERIEEKIASMPFRGNPFR